MKLLATLLLLFHVIIASAEVSVFQPFESGSDGDVITKTILDASVLGTGTWTVTNFTTGASSANQLRITTGLNGYLVRPIIIGSSTNTGIGGTRGMRAYYTNTQRAYVRYNIPDTQKITHGCYLRMSSGWSTIDFNSQNFIVSTCNNGDFMVLNLQNFSTSGTGTNFLQIQTQLGTCESVGGANAETNVFSLYGDAHLNVTYWVSQKFDLTEGSTGRAHIWFYETNTWKRIATCVLDASSTSSTRISRIEFGQYEPHGADQPAGTYTDFSEFTIDTNGTRWPLLPATAIQASPTLSQANVSSAISASGSGDTILLPSDTATWTSGVTVSGNSRTVAGFSPDGNGTNNTVITADGSFTAFTVSGDYNTFTNFQVKGDGTTDEADGFLNTGQHNRYSRLYLRELNVAIYAQDFGLVDNCVIADSWKVARVIFPSSYYASYYPLSWSSTNCMVFEDNRFYWTSAKNQTGSQNLISSQVAQAFVVRHNYFELNNSSTDPAPVIDYHGDDQGSGIPVPGVAMQVYSNYVNFLAGSISGQKFVDVRGSRSLVYSNRFVGASYDSGQGIVYREERPSDSPNYLVNNSYVWENKHGASGTTAMPVNDDANITAGVDYFTTALSPLEYIPYPHPMRGESAGSGQSPSPPAQLKIGSGRAVFGPSSFGR